MLISKVVEERSVCCLPLRTLSLRYCHCVQKQSTPKISIRSFDSREDLQVQDRMPLSFLCVCICVLGGGVPFFLSHDGMYRSSPGRIKTFVNTMAKRPAIRRRPPSTTMTKRLTTPRPLMNRCRFILTKRSRNRAPTCRSATAAAAALEFT